jgi:hypothetical protein
MIGNRNASLPTRGGVARATSGRTEEHADERNSVTIHERYVLGN